MHKVLKELQVLRVQQVLLVLKVLKVVEVQQVLRVHKVSQDLLEHKVPLAHRVLKVLRELISLELNTIILLLLDKQHSMQLIQMELMLMFS